MSERQYFVLCSDNCRFESMTKEQIIEAIAEATGNTPTGVDEAFITKIKERNANENMKFWKGTEAEYNAIETKDTDTVYIIVQNASTPAKFIDTIGLDTAIALVREDLETLENSVDTKTAKLDRDVGVHEVKISALTQQVINLQFFDIDGYYQNAGCVRIGGLMIQWGVIECKDMAATNNSSPYVYRGSVTFQQPFSSVPNILLTQQSNYTDWIRELVEVKFGDGFRAIVHRSQAVKTGSVAWVAIGNATYSDV